MSKHNVHSKDFWKLLQLRSCITTADRKVKFAPVSDIQKLWRSGWKLKGGASRFYDMFRRHQPPNYEGIKLSWEKDLGVPIDRESWEEAIKSWYTIARDMQTRLISFRILNRNYWTPVKMFRLGLRKNDMCWRCDKERGTLIHMLYECDVVHSLWVVVIQYINNALKVELRENPALCILGILQRKTGLSQQLCLWVKLALATGNRVILRHWKSKEKISFKEWRDELTKIASFEQLIYKINNKLDIFVKVWSPFLEMIGN